MKRKAESDFRGPAASARVSASDVGVEGRFGRDFRNSLILLHVTMAHGVLPYNCFTPMMRNRKQRVAQDPIAAPNAGPSFPPGAAWADREACVSILSRVADNIDLLLFSRVDDRRPSCIIPIDPLTHHYWHGQPPKPDLSDAIDLAPEDHPRSTGNLPSRACFNGLPSRARHL